MMQLFHDVQVPIDCRVVHRLLSVRSFDGTEVLDDVQVAIASRVLHRCGWT